MKLGFLGLGAMSTAIINGLRNSKDYDLKTINASSRNLEELKFNCEELGIVSCSSNKELIKNSDVIILGVKPEDLKDLGKEINVYLEDKPIISMAAKTPIKRLIEYFGERPIIRIMPNLNVTINKGSTAITTYNASDDLKESVDSLFSLLGSTYKLEEEQLSGFIAMAGSSPALIYRFINELAKAGMSEGFSKKEALSIVAQTVIGSSEYLSQSEDDPEKLISRVSSKGGTTIEGLKVFDEFNFDTTIKKALEAIVEKDKTG